MILKRLNRWLQKTDSELKKISPTAATILWIHSGKGFKKYGKSYNEKSFCKIAEAFYFLVTQLGSSPLL